MPVLSGASCGESSGSWRPARNFLHRWEIIRSRPMCDARLNPGVQSRRAGDAVQLCNVRMYCARSKELRSSVLRKLSLPRTSSRQFIECQAIHRSSP
jgi:hypothetical protein